MIVHSSLQAKENKEITGLLDDSVTIFDKV